MAFGRKSLKDKIMVTPLGVGKFKEWICKNDRFPKGIYTLISFQIWIIVWVIYYTLNFSVCGPKINHSRSFFANASKWWLAVVLWLKEFVINYESSSSRFFKVTSFGPISDLFGASVTSIWGIKRSL